MRGAVRSKESCLPRILVLIICYLAGVSDSLAQESSKHAPAEGSSAAEWSRTGAMDDLDARPVQRQLRVLACASFLS